MSVWNLFEKYHRQEINLVSRTDSIGWSYIMNSFKDKDARKVSDTELLPFKDTALDDKRTVLVSTLATMKRLIHSKTLPQAVLTELKKIPELSNMEF